MTITDWIKRISGNALNKGWYARYKRIDEYTKHIINESRELHNERKRKKTEIRYQKDGKPCGFPIELSDIVIMCMSTAGKYGIDLENAMKIKQDWNEKYRK